MHKKKREKTESAPPLVKQRTIVGDLGFDVTTLVGGGRLRVRLSGQADDARFILTFEPSVSKRVAEQTTVAITHLPSQGCHCRIIALPPQTDRVQKTLLSNELKFLAFETHAVQLDAADDTLVTRIWIELENVQIKGPDLPPIWQPVIDLRWWFDAARYTALPYFPPDPSIDVTDLGRLGIDPRMVSQRSPLWFKLRGDVTGSAVPRLTGYFAPALGSPAAAKYNFNERDKFEGWKLVNVTMGRLREPVQVACMLAAFPRRSFSETGYHAWAQKPSWGASPDGLIRDPAMTSEMVPAETRAAFPTLDPCAGVVEFKASRLDCEIKGYHLMQCVWEMMCTNVAWCDMVRYSERWERNDATNRFHTTYTCRVVRLFRHAETEQNLCSLIQTSRPVSQRSSADFLRLVWSEPFRACRAHFDALAKHCNADAMHIVVPEGLVAELDRFRATASVAPSAPESPTDGVLARIDARQSEAFNLYTGTRDERRRFVSLAAQQICDYTALIEKVLLE